MQKWGPWEAAMIEKLKKSLGSDGRDRGVFKKVVALVFFGAIILVFAFFGLAPEQFGMSGGGVVAQVNNASISLGDLREATRRMEARFGGGGNAALREFIQAQALENLIEREILFQGSVSSGFHVTNAEVRDILLNIPAFQEDGRFQRSYYENYLKGTKQTAGKFEGDVKKDVVTNRLRGLFETALMPLHAEVAKETALQNKKADIEFISFTEERLILKEAERLSKAQLSAVAGERIAEYYKQNAAEFAVPEEVRAQHILIKTAEGGLSEAEAKKKITEIAERLKNEDFSEVAKKVSEDAGSAAKGGDLGFFPRGQMVPEFEEEAFRLPIGQLSSPVKSSYGFHLIKVLERKEAGTKPLEDVEEAIARKILAREKVAKILEEFERDLRERKEGAVSKFARDYNLNWTATGPFSLSSDRVPQIGANDDLMLAAFRLSEKTSLADRLFTVGGSRYAIRHKAVKSEEPKANKESLVEGLNQEKSYEVLMRLRDDWKKSAEIQKRNISFQ